MRHPRDDLVAQLPYLRAFARSLTRGNRHLADDLVQDTVMLALRGWDRFTPGTNLRSWLLKILHNRFHTLVRRRHVTAEIGDDELLGQQAVPARQESVLELAAFKQGFAELSPAHRTVLVLCVVQGLPYAEVAAICGCEVGTVKSRINRARALLRKRLFGEDDSGDTPDRPAASASSSTTPSRAQPARSRRPNQRRTLAATAELAPLRRGGTSTGSGDVRSGPIPVSAYRPPSP